MGIRNSYSKTDHDATFMRMKEDHILNGQLNPANYETKKKRKTKQNIGRRENLLYREDQDAYVCKAGKHLARGKDRKTKTTSGFADIVWTYTYCEPTQKSIQFSPSFEQHRMQSEANILTDAVIDHRINRSIHSEGAFSKLKDGLGYIRFRHRSMKKVVSDIVLVALGINPNKLHGKILNHQTEIIAYKKTA